MAKTLKTIVCVLIMSFDIFSTYCLYDYGIEYNIPWQKLCIVLPVFFIVFAFLSFWIPYSKDYLDGRLMDSITKNPDFQAFQSGDKYVFIYFNETYSYDEIGLKKMMDYECIMDKHDAYMFLLGYHKRHYETLKRQRTNG